MKKLIVVIMFLGAIVVLAPTIRVQGPPRLILTGGGGGSTNGAIRQFQAGSEFINVTLTNQYQSGESFQN